MLTIENNIFLKDGKPFFYLADTCWSAFTNITEEDWLYYLQYRQRQGYNTLQINILPQWDASGTSLHYVPFLEKGNTYDFTKINDDYFEHARKMCKVAKEHDFELALVVLWCNYVPKTWANHMNDSKTMPFECIEDYIEKVVATFDDFNPLYVVSGDTDFEEEVSCSYYKRASQLLKQKAPSSLQTMHVRGRLKKIPESLLENMDFYMFQSGHNAKSENLPMTYKLPEYFKTHYENKPLFNSEPCYEQMGLSSKMYGRFHGFDIRRAAWQSLLSGASAGITYGAAGIYSWHTCGYKFEMEVGEAFDQPNPWQMAIHYDGAWDYSDIKNIFEDYQLYGIEPAQSLLVNNTEEIRVAMTKDENKIVVYMPENTTLRLKKDVSEYNVTVIDLLTRRKEQSKAGFKKGISEIKLHLFEHDVIFILEKR